MKSLMFLCAISLICISTCTAKDLLVGSNQNSNLVWQQKVEYSSIPFIKRVKEVFYSDPSQQAIKGIMVRDIDHTESQAIITAGGLGFSYVNLRFKSKRGDSLNYQIEIYV